MLAAGAGACGEAPPAAAKKSLFPPPAVASAASAAKPIGVARIQADAKAAEPLVTSAFAKRFLAATAALPGVAPRVLYRTKDKAKTYTAAEAAALAPDARAALVEIKADEELYYNTNYGSPLSYARPLDLLATAHLVPEGGGRVLDFGYGYVGHLRLLASLGFDANGVDVDPTLRALYSWPGDQGPIAGFGGARGGTVKLFDGHYAADAKLTQEVGKGFDVIISKNVLKKGYIHPDRPAEERFLIKLGVDDAVFLGALHDALKPHGALLVFNICPALTPPDKPFIPWSDGRSPFTEAQWAKAGFRVLVFDKDDAPAIRALGHALGWDQPDGDDSGMNLENDLSVLYTLVQRSD